ncbi:MAG: LysR family transcriptional regulator [Solirubrobacteraceae bacterium]|nr:LysR family transcriptional regulator [Solirubrobacteraceae bacterium]
MALDLRKVTHFLAVADERSFTRAAERLFLSQQALSTSIRRLEQELGVTLLERTTRRVDLTAAGEALARDGRGLVAAAATAVRRARQAAGGTRELRVGHSPAVRGEEVSDVTARLVAGDTAPEAAVVITARMLYPADLVDGLRSGDLDLAFARHMEPPAGLAARTIAELPLRVALHRDHALADRPRLAVADLADHPIVVWGEPGRSAYTDFLVGLCRDAGFEPHVERSPMQGTPPITSVTRDDHVAFVTDPTGPARDGRVIVRDLEPEVHVALRVLWNPEHRSPLVAELLDG